MLSLSTPEYAVRKMVSAISSAMESKVFLNSSKAMGSRGVVMPAASWRRSPVGARGCRDRCRIGREVDDDVAPGVQGRPCSRGHHAGGVVLLDDERAGAPGARDRRARGSASQPRVLGAEVDAPASHRRRPLWRGRAPGARAPAGDRECPRHHAEAHELDGLVRPGAMAVGALVLAPEGGLDAGNGRPARRSRQGRARSARRTAPGSADRPSARTRTAAPRKPSRASWPRASSSMRAHIAPSSSGATPRRRRRCERT